ncbi:MAG: YfiR family protein [Ideonella sp.]|nr:YfiR family protein [Ideonella sp.]MBL0149926.1 YfiR family protein [Ideonella sp.]
MKSPAREVTEVMAALWLATLLLFATGARADDLPEYRLKSAFVYNFMLFTEWPAATGNTLNLCIYGKDPFGAEIDGLQGKAVVGRSIALHRKATGESLKNCQAVFIAASVMGSLPNILESLKGQSTLTLADSPGAMRQGVALNMGVAQGKVSFEANLQVARSAGLNLSSKLLRLATEVQQ